MGETDEVGDLRRRIIELTEQIDGLEKTRAECRRRLYRLEAPDGDHRRGCRFGGLKLADMNSYRDEDCTCQVPFSDL